MNNKLTAVFVWGLEQFKQVPKQGQELRGPRGNPSFVQSALKMNASSSRKTTRSSRAFPPQDGNDQPSNETSDGNSPVPRSRKLSPHAPAKENVPSGHAKAVELSSNDDDLTDDLIISRVRRKRSKPTAPTRQRTEQAENRIHSDNEFNEDSTVLPTQKNRSQRLNKHLEPVDIEESAPEVAAELEDDVHDLRDTGKCLTLRYNRKCCGVAPIVSSPMYGTFS